MISIEYLAGFFDGEGSVGLYASSSSKRHSLRVCINQVESDVSRQIFLEILSRFGGGFSFPKRAKPHHRQAISWSVYGDDAVLFLRSIEPHLLLKKGEVQAVLAWQNKWGGDRAHPKDPERSKIRQEEAIQVMRALRAGRSKGPSPTISVKG